MKLILKNKDIKAYLLVVLYLSLWPVMFFSLKIFGVIFTYSGSVPIGFYQIINNDKPIQAGDIISFCLSDTIAKFGISHGYLSHGSCVSGSEPLIKEVVAIPGDQVIVSRDHIKVIHNNTIRTYFSPTDIKDKHHLSVKRFIKSGSYVATGYWVYGFGNPTYSWDSRYYGEMVDANVTHRLLPLLVWHH